MYYSCSILTKIKDAYDNNSGLQNLLLDPYFKGIVTEYQDALREVVATGVKMAYQHLVSQQVSAIMIATVQKHLPANLIQAQRDYFGAHTYERKDKDGIFHTQWTEE